MKHLICTINKVTGSRLIEDVNGKVIEHRDPESVYTAHKEAWSSLLRLYENNDYIENSLEQ